MSDRRPVGVSVLGYLYCIIGILFACGTLIAIFAPSQIVAHLGKNVLSLIAIIFSLIAVVFLVLGIALLKLKKWAWIGTIVLNAIVILFDLLRSFRYSYSIILLLVGLIRPLIAAIIIWYLTHPNIKKQFN